ncbi:MAG: hypothetical protein D6706_04620 [Chloroflexi bacterium]|nr:MAG: hypothetical protein D6706_04620 [Chloroflexota bacterium]
MTDEILTNYQHVIDRFILITGEKGAFEVKVNDDVIFSKKTLGRHAEPGEVLRLFKEYIGPDVEPYPRSK